LFIKLRFRVDLTGIVTLTFFWISAVAKMVSSIQIEMKGLTGLASGISIMAV
jgi:hypothetical protein